MGKESELMMAVKHGDVPAVRKALQKYKANKSKKPLQKKQAHVKQPDSDGFSVLHHGALSGNTEVVSALIEMEADINARDNKGMCPLHMAAWAGKDAVVQALVDSKALVNLPSFNGETALHLGAQHGYGTVVDVLLKSKADPTLRNNNFETPLDLACQYGHSLVARILLRHDGVLLMLQCRQQDPRHKSPLHVAARTGHADIVRMLLECGGDVNEETPDGTCLHEAALFGKSDVVRLLLEAGADVGSVNKNGMTALDIVNKFTSSRAAVEIKQLLREASGETVLFAKAIMNYRNPLDGASLTFSAGDIIMVVEQGEDGMWRGSLQSDRDARVGTFPSTAVQVVAESSFAPSGGSSLSSVDSSLSNSSARDLQSNGTRNSPQKSSPKVSPKPVGMVPIGTYEVVALATAQPPAPAKKHQPPIPRMSSFKKKSPPRTKREIPAPVPNHPPNQTQQDVMPNGIHARRNTTATTDMRSTTGNGDVRHASNERDARADSVSVMHPRTRSTSGSVTHHDLAYAAKQALGKKLQHGDKPLESHQPQSDQPQSDRIVNRTTKPGVDKARPTQPTSYTSVVVGDPSSDTGHESHDTGTVIRVPKKINEEGYEEMRFDRPSQVSTKSMKSPPEVKKRQKTIMRTGYEDMTKGNDDAAPSIPLKTTTHKPKSPPPSPDDILPNPQATKIIGTGAARRQDCYENVTPRVQAVQPPTPFEGSYGKSNYQQPNATSYSKPVTKPSESDRHEYHNINVTHSEQTQHPADYSVPSAQHDLRPTKNADQGSVRYKAPVPLSPGCSSPTSSVGSNPDFEQAYLKLLGENLNEADRETLTWLKDIKLGHYFENFHAEGYDMTSIRGITPEDLTEIGIVKAGHRKKLLSQIPKLPPVDTLPSRKPHDVAVWLAAIGLIEYEPNFVEGGFDDIDFIKDLDRNDLETIEIKKRGHQKKLLLAVRALSDLDLTASLDNVFGGDNFPSPIPSPLSPHPPINSQFPTGGTQPRTQFSLEAGLLPSSLLAHTTPYPQPTPAAIVTEKRPDDDDTPPELPKKTGHSLPKKAVSPPPVVSGSPERTHSPPAKPALSSQTTSGKMTRQGATLLDRRSLKGSGKPKVDVPQRTASSSDNSPSSSPRTHLDHVRNDDAFRQRTTSAPGPQIKPKPKAQLNMGQVRTEAEIMRDPQTTTASGHAPHRQQQHQQTVSAVSDNARKLADHGRLSPRTSSDEGIQRTMSAVVRPSDSAMLMPVKLPKPSNHLERTHSTHSNPGDVKTKRGKPPPPVAQKKPTKPAKDGRSDEQPASVSPVQATSIPDPDPLQPNHVIPVVPEPETDLLDQVLNEQEPTTSADTTNSTPSNKPQDDTELLMADLDDIINDFSTQLDSMFE